MILQVRLLRFPLYEQIYQQTNKNHSGDFLRLILHTADYRRLVSWQTKQGFTAL